MNNLLIIVKRLIKKIPWLYKFCLAVYFTPRTLRTLPFATITAMKRFIKASPRLYALCLKIYFTPRMLRAFPSAMIMVMKRFIKASPRLYALCLKVYFAPRTLYAGFTRLWLAGKSVIPTRRQLRDRLYKHPHIFLYARYGKDLCNGKILNSLGKITRQIAIDWHNARLLRKDRLALEKLYQEAILCCIRHRAHRWWNFLPNAKFDSVHVLQTFLRDCVLRRAGDYNEFLRIRKALKQLAMALPANEQFFDQIAEYYAKVIDDMDAGRLSRGLKPDKSKRPFLIGFSVWGEHYLNMLLNYCLPSLLAEGNLPALCKERQPILFIHTNPAGKQVIEQADVTRRIKALGVVILYQMVNEDLVKYLAQSPDYKYWHLGMVQSLDLYFAKTLDADFHIFFPDTIYSDQHFAGLLRAAARGHKAITRLGLSTRMEGICPAIENYRRDGAISIPAADLTALGVAHVHSASWSWLATHNNLTEELPNVCMIIWEGKDTLHMFSPHQTILYLDREVVRRLSKRFYLTLDGELDKIIPEGCPVYCPKPEDALGMVEVTPENQRPTELVKYSMQDFSTSFWHAVQESMTYWRFFNEEIVDPLNRALLPNRSYMDDAEIKQAQNTVRNALLQAYPLVSAEQLQMVLEILRGLETHPKAKRIRSLIDETAQSIQNMVVEEYGTQPAPGWHNGDRFSKQKLILENKNKLALKRLYHEAILCCIRHRVHRWWSFLPNAKFDSVHVLQTFLRDCVLRRAGDYQEFLRIRKEFKLLAVALPAHEQFFDDMAWYYAKTIDDMDAGHLSRELALSRDRRPFLIGFSVWGARYLNMLIDYCLPSLLAEGNLPALCNERQPILFIHTDPEGKQILEQADVIKRIKALGVVVLYQMVNEALVAYFEETPDYKYWHLGMVQSLDLYFAKTLDADYHLLMPDSIYSEHHFTGLLRAASRGHQAITRLMLSTRMEGICPAVESYRHDGAISVPAADLAALSVTHVHSASRCWIITHNNLVTELPNVHVTIWEGENTLHMLSSHQTLLYLDREITRKLPKRFYLTLDSELDKIIPEDCPVYCSKLEDEICLVEATSEKQRPTELIRYPIKEFCRVFWYSTQESMAYWKFFNDTVIDPLNRELLSNRNYMSDAEIEHAKRTVRDALLETYPVVSAEQAQLALEILQAVQDHPDAQHMMDIIRETTHSIQDMVEEQYRQLLTA